MTREPAPLWLEDLPPPNPSLRLAVVTETWPPEVNGVALTLSRLVQGLRSRNHRIQLVRPRQATDAEVPLPGEGVPDEMLMRGLPIPRYPGLRLGLPARRTLVSAWSWQRPDLVHIATEGPLGWSALQAARRLRLPVTSDFRTNFHHYSQHYGMGWLRKPIAGYLRKFHNRTHCTMVPTQALCDELAASGFQRLQVVARGVDTHTFHPARRSAALRAAWGADDDTLVMLSVGRLAPEKNLELTVQAYEVAAAAAQAHRRAVRLVFVGDGPLRERLQARCPQAVFAGQRGHVELATYYASADLFVFPSLSETFGNVTLEALACGLPVLAYDCAAASDWVRDGVNGWLVPAGQVREFVARAAELAQAPQAIRAAAGQQAGQVAQMDWRHIALQVERVFLDAIRAQASMV